MAAFGEGKGGIVDVWIFLWIIFFWWIINIQLLPQYQLLLYNLWRFLFFYSILDIGFLSNLPRKKHYSKLRNCSFPALRIIGNFYLPFESYAGHAISNITMCMLKTLILIHFHKKIFLLVVSFDDHSAHRLISLAQVKCHQLGLVNQFFIFLYHFHPSSIQD